MVADPDEIIDSVIAAWCYGKSGAIASAEQMLAELSSSCDHVEGEKTLLVNLLATFCILSWRIFWLTILNRSTKQAKAILAFTPLEIELLSRLAPERRSTSSTRPPSLQSCLTQLARLGGDLNRAGDAPPGNTVIWRGMSQLTDIEIGYLIGTGNVGN